MGALMGIMGSSKRVQARRQTFADDSLADAIHHSISALDEATAKFASSMQAAAAAIDALDTVPLSDPVLSAVKAWRTAMEDAQDLIERHEAMHECSGEIMVPGQPPAAR